MLRTLDMSAGFDGQCVLRDISVKIYPGDRIAVIGPSGSGKTTLLRVLVGLLRPISGRVTLEDKEIWGAEPSHGDSRRDDFVLWPFATIVFQELNLFANLSALENCLIGIAQKDMERAEQDLLQFSRRLQVEECLERKPRYLSHGQRQRIAILRALTRRPKYLFLDEPTSSLDPDSRGRLADLLSDTTFFKETAIVTATHDLHFSNEFANRFWSISDRSLIFNEKFSDAVSIYGRSEG